MSDIKNFFYDRFVLFCLTVNSFLLLVNILGVLLRIGGSGGVYVNSYRSNLGLSSISAGGVAEIISFIIFAIGLYVIQLVLAIRFYSIRRSASWFVLVMTMLLLILNLIVSKSLLDLK